MLALLGFGIGRRILCNLRHHLLAEGVKNFICKVGLRGARVIIIVLDIDDCSIDFLLLIMRSKR